MTSKHTHPSAFLFVVTALTLWAAFLRFYQLESLSPPAWYDEIWYALRAREILTTGHVPAFYITAFGGANAGPVYMTAIAQALGIQTMTSTRWAAAAAGVIAVPLAYACTRELLTGDPGLQFNATQRRLAAALTALVMAYLLFFVITNRMGMENGVAPATALLILWQMQRALNKGTLNGWAVAGLVIGASQYNGLHARFILPVVGFFLLQALIAATPAQRLRMLQGVALMGLIAGVVMVPLLRFFLTHPEMFTARASIVAQPMVLGQPATYPEMLAHNARMIALAFSFPFAASLDPKFTVPGVPILDWAQTGGFIAGLIWCALNLRRSSTARLLPAWLIITALPSLLTEGAPNLGRMIGVAAPTAALVGIGWAVLYWRVETAVPSSRFTQQHLAAAALGVVLGSMGYQAYLMFYWWPKAPNMPSSFTVAPVQTALDLESTAAQQPVFVGLIPEAADIAAFEWQFAGERSPITRLDLRKCLPLPHQRPSPTTYLIITGRDEQTLPNLLRAYPDSQVHIHPEIDLWQTTATRVQITSGAAPALPRRPVQAAFEAGISLYGVSWSAERLTPGETLFVTLYWQASERVPQAYTSFTHFGSGMAGEPLITQHDGQPCLGLYPTDKWQPGEIITDSFALRIPQDAAPGLYTVSTGWYAFPSLERLPLLAADQSLPDDRAVLGQVEVTSPQ